MPDTPVSPKELFPLMFEMGRLLKHELAKDGAGPLSYLHQETLRFIREQEDPDMQAVADYLRIAALSATRLVGALVDEGLLARKSDTSDRRRVRLAVSPKGERMLVDAARARTRAYARVLAPLDARDRAAFKRILSIITRTD